MECINSKNLNKSYGNNDSESSVVEKIKVEPDNTLIHNDDILIQLQESSDIEVEPSFSIENDTMKNNYNEQILMQRMDIREPLSTLKILLEQELGKKLSGYSFWLQDSQKMESHKNLVDQCVQGEGFVQVNVQLQEWQKRINIIDVLKPAEDYIDVADNTLPVYSIEDNKVTRWMVDTQYKRDQDRLKIPSDPKDWSQTHVKHWLQWAVRQFNLVSLRLIDWNITGSQLCDLTIDEFRTKVPFDPGDLFWTHLEILRKEKIVAVVQKDQHLLEVNNLSDQTERKKYINNIKPQGISDRVLDITNVPLDNLESSFILTGSNKTVNNGQIQLWQFLLELLTDKEHTHAIQWVGIGGEFKLNQPETVAQLWGARKNKPSMNYEKLSRALRYYYDGDMISKVQGKRFVYKFVCDLKHLLGYSAAELSKLVNKKQYF